jgi:hypothetical protein
MIGTGHSNAATIPMTGKYTAIKAMMTVMAAKSPPSVSGVILCSKAISPQIAIKLKRYPFIIHDNLQVSKEVTFLSGISHILPDHAASPA